MSGIRSGEFGIRNAPSDGQDSGNELARVYHNMPLEPVSGKNGIREVLNLFLPAEKIEAEIVHLVARGNLVFTERVDRFRFGEKRVELPCAGVFEIRDDKIAAWRDYFDLATWQRQTA